ncbi:MAG: phosphopyruvate hydratase [Candidatus Bathyarchaeota archaeon]|nr:phosphopyruvate hydratase [Candidatus Bathyarchaeota archaeon]MCZ2845080.1 phosphopyruvate hydratase [Candidatus Bathyarchaeota archaeon]
MDSRSVIENIKARKIFDSRGNDAIEVDIITKGGFGRFSPPSGASTGRWEVQAYPNDSVDEAIKITKERIKPEMIGMNVDDQENIDSFLHDIDGTKKFIKIGGNTALAISISSAVAAASSKNIPLFQHLSDNEKIILPHPLGNILGGGMHAKGEKTDIQEFLSLPLKADTFLDAAKANIEMHQILAEIILSKGDAISGKGDEGAWISGLDTLEALERIDEARSRVEETLDVTIGIGLDMAASTLWNEKENRYIYKKDGKKLDSGQQIDFVLSLINNFGLIYVEDPVHEEDFESFAELSKKNSSTLLCGDDLFTTNIDRLNKGIELSAGNSIIIKPNQVGTLSDTFTTVKRAHSSGYTTITSHRSGETCESLITHLSIAFNSPIVKTGVMGGERVGKINELIRIEDIFYEKAMLADVSI